MHEAPDTGSNDEYWRSITIEKPIPESVRAMAQLDLEDLWHFEREAEFRENVRIAWATVDEQKIILEDFRGKLTPKQAYWLFNKPTAFYWLQSAQPLDADRKRTRTPKIILAAIYQEWVKAHGNVRPNIEFDHFLANPVRITPEGPQTVPEPIKVNDFAHHRGVDLRPMVSPYYSLLPLYRAVIIIIDRLETNVGRDDDGLIDLGKVASNQTVLVARTGDEDGLSTPICLSKLGAKPFRLERFGGGSQGLETVRVLLAAAVRFIADLER
ncbi:MAG: hypothetical protein Q9160_002090 [Pyrenula sp. 1 TL-2023]